jgi:hypothetical protein
MTDHQVGDLLQVAGLEFQMVSYDPAFQDELWRREKGQWGLFTGRRLVHRRPGGLWSCPGYPGGRWFGSARQALLEAIRVQQVSTEDQLRRGAALLTQILNPVKVAKILYPTVPHCLNLQVRERATIQQLGNLRDLLTKGSDE